MPFSTSFSSRHGYIEPAKDITVREDAPETLRYFVLETARELGFGPSDMRPILCKVCRSVPDRNNWSEYPNIWDEVQQLMSGCAWFRVYDVIEALYAAMEQGYKDVQQLAASINGFFVEEGIGWQLVQGQIVTRGDETFEAAVKSAEAALANTGRLTAAKNLKEALLCLSRRPDPNTSGAVFHAMGALECVARDLTGDAKATLGDILKRYPALLPKPLDTALSQIWGYSSNEARHVSEGREIKRDEAELVVGLSAAVGSYLSRKQDL